MDNLVSHHHPMVLALVRSYGHHVIFRAPYHAIDGPIEYVFNTIECVLSDRMFQIRNLQQLETNLRAVIRAIPSFEQYFTHCGYTN